jgi:RecA/RadA recombinase
MILISSLSLASKKGNSVMTALICTLQGRIVEIYGQEASGKTTLALHVIKEAQKLGGAYDFFSLIPCDWKCFLVSLQLVWFAKESRKLLFKPLLSNLDSLFYIDAKIHDCSYIQL